MDKRAAFKFAFIARGIELGLTVEQMLANVRQARASQDKTAFDMSSVKPLVGAALMAPPLVGGAAAYVARQATDADDVDVQDIQRQELTATYQRMARQLQRQRELRRYKQETAGSARPVRL